MCLVVSIIIRTLQVNYKSPGNMSEIKDIISERNDTRLRIALSLDVRELKILTDTLHQINYKLRSMTLIRPSK